MFDLNNPIPLEIVDLEDLRKVMEKYSIVPYYGSNEGTSHSFLNLLKDVTANSETFQASTRSINTYAFGLNPRIVKKPIEGLGDENMEPEFAPRATEKEIAKWLKEIGISLKKIKACSKELHKSLFSSGNGWLKITLIETAGIKTANCEVIPYTRIAYQLPKNNSEDRKVVITKKWDLTYMEENPPEIIHVSTLESGFVWSQKGKGKIQTVLHVGWEKIDSDFYYRPPILAVLDRMFVEFSMGGQMCKAVSSEVIAKNIIFVESPVPEIDRGGPDDDDDFHDLEDPFENMAWSLQQVSTNKGDFESAASLALVEYPNGTTSPIVKEFKVNRDYKYNEWASVQSEFKICGSLKWSPELNGSVKIAAGLNGDVLMSIFKEKNVSTIIPLQQDNEDLWSAVMEQIFEFGGKSVWSEFGLHNPSMASKLIAELTVSNSNENAIEPPKPPE